MVGGPGSPKGPYGAAGRGRETGGGDRRLWKVLVAFLGAQLLAVVALQRDPAALLLGGGSGLHRVEADIGRARRRTERMRAGLAAQQREVEALDARLHGREPRPTGAGAPAALRPLHVRWPGGGGRAAENAAAQAAAKRGGGGSGPDGGGGRGAGGGGGEGWTGPAAPEVRPYKQISRWQCAPDLDRAATGVTAAVVVVTFQRHEYLQRSLASLLMARKTAGLEKKFPIVISQDVSPKQPFPAVDLVAKHFAQKEGVAHLQHRQGPPPGPEARKFLSYYRIADHYGWFLAQVFECMQYERVVIVEEDMEFSPDFFEYFEAMKDLVDHDENLLAVSSWNDNGQKRYVKDPDKLFRSDFFPGLGWMMRRALWDELGPIWPTGFWDDWLRREDVRKGRHCIFPEVPRNQNFGRIGASGGLFFDKFIKPVEMNRKFVRFTEKDVSYLTEGIYDSALKLELEEAQEAPNMPEAMRAKGPAKVFYRTQQEYERLAMALGIMPEWKSGIPRGAYKGTVVVRFAEATIYLTPHSTFQKPKDHGEGTTFTTGDGQVVHAAGARTP